VGLPVITTAVSGIPELVENNQNGLLCRPRDVEAFRPGLLSFFAMPRNASN